MYEIVRKAQKSNFFIFFVLITLLFNTTIVQGMPLLQEDPTETPDTASPADTQSSVTTIAEDVVLPEVNTFNGTAQFTLAALGGETVELRYPARHSIDMPLPNYWVIAGGEYSYINLHYDMYDERSVTQSETKLYEGIGYPHISVYIDEYLAGTFIPESGPNHSVRIPIPISAMIERRFNPYNLHTITVDFYVNRDDYCYYEGIFTLYNDSAISLSYTNQPITRDLSDFPHSIVQDTFFPETLYFVVPDEYSESDIAAASTIAAAIGKFTITENINIKVIPASQATSALLSKSNAVIIGKSNENSYLSHLTENNYLYTHLSSDKTKTQYLGKDIDSTVGVLQLVPSEFDDNYTFLVVTGNSDEALLQSALELTSPTLGLIGDFALIQPSLTQEEPTIIDSKDTYTFEDLGLADRTWFGLGQYKTTYVVFIPNHWKVQDGANLVLDYAHSSNLSGNNSSLSVRINGRLIGNATIDGLISGDKQITIPITPTNLIPGTLNTIQFEALLSANVDCANILETTHWLTIRNTSYIKIKHEATTKGLFVHPTVHLAYDPRVLFVVPPQPTEDEMNGAIELALLLGGRGQRGFDFLVSFDPNLDLSQYPEYHIVMIGKPTRNEQIVKINELLPQPFVPGEDALMQTGGGIAYRIPAGISIGVVEVIPATWNATRGITIISGTTDEGFKWSLDAVTDPERLFDFAGDVFFISETRLESIYSQGTLIDTLDSIVGNVVKTQTVLETVAPVPTSTQQINNEDAQAGSTPVTNVTYFSTTKPEKGISSTGLYALYGLIVVAVIILIAGAIRAARGGRSL